MYLQNKIVEVARSFIGSKYHHQGRMKKTDNHDGGIDCIGLIIEVARKLSIKGSDNKDLSFYNRLDYSYTPSAHLLPEFLDKHLIKIDQTKITNGDVLLFGVFGNSTHVGITFIDEIGNLGIIHCYESIGKVTAHLLSKTWQRMIISAYRFRS